MNNVIKLICKYYCLVFKKTREIVLLISEIIGKNVNLFLIIIAISCLTIFCLLILPEIRALIISIAGHYIGRPLNNFEYWNNKLMEYGYFFLIYGVFFGIISIFSIYRFELQKVFTKLISLKLFNKSNITFTYILSFLIIFLVLFFIIFIAYFRQPLGDDVLFQFTDGYRNYIDGYVGDSGNQVKDLSSLFISVKGIYLHHGGRIIGFTLIPLLSIFGQMFISIVTGICFVFLLLLAGGFIFGNFKELFKHPLVILFLFLLLFYFNPSMKHLLMWTMTSIYIVSLILLGTYFYIFKEKLKFCSIALSKKNIILFNILGFLAGFTHEVFGFTILSLIVFFTVKEIVVNKLPVKRILYHTGLFLGTILCFTAPGNIMRLSGSHDAIRFSAPYILKLLGVFTITKEIIYGVKCISLLLFLFLILIIILKYISSNNSFTSKVVYFIKKNYVDIFFLAYLLIIWSLFPYIGTWGTLLFLFWFTIFIFKNILVYSFSKEENFISKFEKNIFGFFLVGLIVLILIIQNFSWMTSMAKTTIERNTLISNAIKNNKISVDVPLYSNICSNRFTFYNYNNFLRINENESIYYIKYFHLKMKVK
ncbi:MAG: DUF6056 family protein [Candidatus Margulisiibacteriota bacterium]|jgi:hypothetical protein